jgi:predicted O-methyltransferase YrrM
MGSLKASFEYAEGFVPEDGPLQAARQRATELGVSPIGPGGGNALRLLATLVGAKAVIEVGTGTGVSGTWLLRGMQPDGMLTTIDVEPEHQRMAKKTFEEAGYGMGRVRLISGAALEVMPRFNESAYDLLFVDGDKSDYPRCFEEGLRLLRPGGVLAFDNALWHDQVADANAVDPDTEAIREVCRLVKGTESVVPALLPVGDGLLIGVKTA